jgi:hypothetical protein
MPATCGSSEPLATVGDRPCPCSTVVTRTQRGPSVVGLAQLGSGTRRFDYCSTAMDPLGEVSGRPGAGRDATAPDQLTASRESQAQ